MTQLELWNLACSLVGVTQQITSTDSEMNHARLCAQFEALALESVIAEWHWSFLTAQEPLVLDCQEVALLSFKLVGDADEVQYVSIETDANVGLDDGDTVIITGTCSGVVYDGEEFPVKYVGALTEVVPEEEPPPPP